MAHNVEIDVERHGPWRCPTCHARPVPGQASIHWRATSEGGLRECPHPCHVPAEDRAFYAGTPDWLQERLSARERPELWRKFIKEADDHELKQALYSAFALLNTIANADYRGNQSNEARLAGEFLESVYKRTR